MESKGLEFKDRRTPFVVHGAIAASTSAAVYYWLKMPANCRLVDAHYMQTVAANGSTNISINTVPDDNATDAETIKNLVPGVITLGSQDSGTQVEIMTIATLTALGSIDAKPVLNFATDSNRVVGGNEVGIEIILPQSAVSAHSGELFLYFVEN